MNPSDPNLGQLDHLAVVTVATPDGCTQFGESILRAAMQNSFFRRGMAWENWFTFHRPGFVAQLIAVQDWRPAAKILHGSLCALQIQSCSLIGRLDAEGGYWRTVYSPDGALGIGQIERFLNSENLQAATSDKERLLEITREVFKRSGMGSS